MSNALKTNGKPTTPPPNQTLYVTNLSDKIPKQELRYALYGLFATYGAVLDVVALKTMKMRGQAHIVFRDVQASSQALRSLQGFKFFGKEMQINYAKSKSNIISRLDGTAKGPDAKQIPEQATETQKSVFNNPNAPELSQAANGLSVPSAGAGEAKTTQGIKRAREDEDEDEAGVAPIEEDDDEGEAMEESDDED